MLPALRWSEASSTRIILAVKSRSLSLRANSSLQRKPDAAANRMIVAYCSLRAAPKLSIVCRCAAICSACFQEYETLRRLLIRISSLSRSGISSAPKEKGGFLSFENEDRTRCIVLRESLIEVQETPASTSSLSATCKATRNKARTCLIPNNHCLRFFGKENEVLDRINLGLQDCAVPIRGLRLWLNPRRCEFVPISTGYSANCFVFPTKIHVRTQIRIIRSCW